MRPFPTLPCRSEPFAHVLTDDFLDAELYAALQQSFPSCEANSGPTGYSLFRGDPGFDRLLAAREEWRSLSERVQSQDFVRYVLAHFPKIFAEEAVVDLSAATYSDRVESRAEKELPSIRAEGDADALFVRMDILQGRPGYSREPHLDHRRRAVTMLIYFSDQADDGIAGGELVLIGTGKRRDAITLPLRRNRMVMFPCYNRSFHAVRPIIAQKRPRNFLQITVSSCVDLWRPVRPTAVSRAARIVRGTAAAAARHLRRIDERPAAPGQAIG